MITQKLRFTTSHSKSTVGLVTTVIIYMITVGYIKLTYFSIMTLLIHTRKTCGFQINLYLHYNFDHDWSGELVIYTRVYKIATDRQTRVKSVSQSIVHWYFERL